MPREGSNAFYRAYADRWYLDKANRDTYLARQAAGDILLSGNLALPALSTLDGVDLSVHAADIDAHMRDFLQLLRTGEYLGYPFNRGSLDWAISANTLYACPLYIARNVTIDRIAINVTVAGAAGTKGRLGIYKAGTNLYPGALVVDGGEVAVDAIAVVAATISQALTEGLYFTALVSNGTPTIKSLYSTWAAMGKAASDLVSEQNAWNVAFTYAALPNPFTAGATFLNHTPVILPRIASLD